MLKIYKDEKKIFAISGNCFLKNLNKPNEAQYYFSKYSFIWGWATWKNRWEKFDRDISFWPKFKKSKKWRI